MATLAEFKKARYDYEILHEFEAGLELLGTEVKSIRAGRAKLDGAHIVVRGGEAYLLNASIPPWQSANAGAEYDPERKRRLLLNKKELAAIARAEEEKGQTVIPRALYEKGPRIKMRVAIVRGKKKYDKRESLKKREAQRDIARALKQKT